MPLQVGDQAPLFSATDILTGQNFNLFDHKGKCVLVGFHGITWCGPCGFAAPILQELWDEGFGSNPGVQFVIVSVNESPDPTALKSLGFTIPWVVSSAVVTAYQTESSVPNYFFLDHDLKIYKIQTGLFSSDHDTQKAAVRLFVKACSEDHTPAVDVDLGRWLAVATILVGVTQDGGGIQIVGGKLQKVPPWDPPFRHLSAPKKDLLVALAASELSGLVTDVDARRKLESAAIDAARSAVERLKGAGGPH